MKIVHFHAFDPNNSLFKKKANDRACVETVSCSAEKCELRDRKECSLCGVFGEICPNGRYSRTSGPTKRSRNTGTWVQEQRKQHEGVPTLGYPTSKMAICGDYVYLPYSHINLNQGGNYHNVPFLKDDMFLVSGSRFVKMSHFTPENILKLIDFRPQALMGGTIQSYQNEEVPKFKTHLKETMPELWAKVVALRPSLGEFQTKTVGRKAYLKTLVASPDKPITIGPYDGRYPVIWTFDGEKLRTTSINAYSDTWGNIKISNLELVSVVDDKQIVVVKDASWVGPNTRFAD